MRFNLKIIICESKFPIFNFKGKVVTTNENGLKTDNRNS